MKRYRRTPPEGKPRPPPSPRAPLHSGFPPQSMASHAKLAWTTSSGCSSRPAPMPRFSVPARRPAPMSQLVARAERDARTARGWSADPPYALASNASPSEARSGRCIDGLEGVVVEPDGPARVEPFSSTMVMASPDVSDRLPLVALDEISVILCRSRATLRARA
jgi:hypothetical protein